MLVDGVEKWIGWSRRLALFVAGKVGTKHGLVYGDDNNKNVGEEGKSTAGRKRGRSRRGEQRIAVVLRWSPRWRTGCAPRWIEGHQTGLTNGLRPANQNPKHERLNPEPPNPSPLPLFSSTIHSPCFFCSFPSTTQYIPLHRARKPVVQITPIFLAAIDCIRLSYIIIRSPPSAC